MLEFTIAICVTTMMFLASGLAVADGGQEYQESVTQLTFEPSVDYYPGWSPDGKYIVFSSDRAGQNLWIVPSEGGTPVQLTEIDSNHPSWSPDGSLVAFDSERGSIVRVVPASGGVPIRIVPDTIVLATGAHPCWSRDGTKVTFSSVGDIWMVDLPSGKLTRIFHKDEHFARAFSWSPDGEFITADVGGKDKSDDNIWLIPVGGGEPIVLTDFPGREGNPNYSPDGSMIVYMHDSGGKKELRIMSSDGGKWISITDYEGFNANPRWSPDGTKIAFSSDRSGSPDIYVMQLKIDLVKETLGLSD